MRDEDTLAATSADSSVGGRTEDSRLSGRAPERERGELVGRYVILAKLGAGGMGVVYAAYDPELDRKVAVKLLLGASDGPGESLGRARMLREAQSLAKLAHPHVVAIHDVGEDGGQVFLAMEFVEGQTLREWLAARPRSWREVVAILRAAGEGLAAAHAKGLLHRDVKPDNVMVADDGRVRVMDFGLARSSADTDASPSPSGIREAEPLPRRTVDVALTDAGAMLGTPAYMAPEQLSGAELTPAADQFGFCVTAWEAVHGERPFAGGGLFELANNVLEGRLREPPRDSTAPAWLTAAIVRGLASEPGERYRDMPALLTALAEGEARWQRRRVQSRVAVLLVSLAGLVAAGWGWDRWREAEQLASCEAVAATIDADWNPESRARLDAGLRATEVSYAASTADKVAAAFDQHAAAWRAASREACVAAEVEGSLEPALYQRARACLDDRRLELVALRDELTSADRESVHKAIHAATSMGMIDPCLDPARLRRMPAVRDGDEIVDVRVALSRAAALRAAGRYPEGLREAAAAVAQAEATHDVPLFAAATVALGRAQTDVGEYGLAEASLEDAYFRANEVGAADTAVDAATELIATVGDLLARGPEGHRWGRHAATLLAQLDEPEDSLRRATWLNAMGNVAFGLGEWASAKQRYTEALVIRTRVLGPEHPRVAALLTNLGIAHAMLGELDEAVRRGEEALATAERALGAEHPDVALALTNLGNIEAECARPEAARVHYEQALATYERALGPEHPDVAMVLNNLGILDVDLGDLDQAKRRYERALTIWEQTLGDEHPDLAASLTNLGQLYLELGDLDTAERRFARAQAILEAARGPEHPELAFALQGLAAVARGRGELDRAVPLLERAWAVRAAQADTGQTAQASFVLAEAVWDAAPTDPRARARARALAEAARATFRDSAHHAEPLAEVDAWLATHVE